MRRWLVPLLLALLTAGFAFLAARTPVAAKPAITATGSAPVLSARRVPDLVSSFVADSRLADRVDAFLRDVGEHEACAVVRQGPRTVYERDPRRALIPASNLKILIAHAALKRLAPTTRFETLLMAHPPSAAGVIEDSLWLVGGGDPLLATDGYVASLETKPVHTRFEAVADAVVSAGIREIRGGVVGDESRYDTQRFIPTWRRGYVTQGVVGPLSALAVNDGFRTFSPNKVVADEPAAHAASLLTELLRARGVTVAGPASARKAPQNVPTVARVQSLTVAEIVGEMLGESDNNTAELLVKELGFRFAGSGTTAAGLDVVQQTLAESGLPTEGLATVDGSGLDRSDRATCQLLVDALVSAGPEARTGLAVAGRTGTLHDKFRGSPVVERLHAKTGSLDGVTALTGYLDGSGGSLAFSLVVNGLPAPTDVVGQRLQERFGVVLATYPEAPSADELSAPDR